MEGIRRVLLADTGEEFRDGFAAAVENEPDIQIVGQTGDGAELLRLTQSLQPDVIVMEMVLTSLDGLEVLDGLAKLEHRPRVVILSSYIRDRRGKRSGLLSHQALPGQHRVRAHQAGDLRRRIGPRAGGPEHRAGDADHRHHP